MSRASGSSGDSVQPCPCEECGWDSKAEVAGFRWCICETTGVVNLDYSLWTSQQEAVEACESGLYDVIAFMAGYRAGKSVTGARWLLSNALRYPNSRWIAMGIDYAKANQTTYRTLFEQLPGERTHIITSDYNGPEQSPVVADYNKQDRRLTLVNDAIIILGSADRWNRYAGDEYSGAWLDETGHYGDELHGIRRMLGTRMTHNVGPKVQFWTSTGDGYNAMYEVLEERVDEHGDDIDVNIRMVKASNQDNPFLSAGDRERLARQYAGSSLEEQGLNGGFAVAKGLVYPFSRADHVVSSEEAYEMVKGSWRCYGYDYGWNDPRVVLEVGRTPKGQLVVLDEFYRSETHVEDAIAWLEDNDKPRGRVYADHDPSDTAKFRRAGWPAVPAKKSIDAGIAEVRNRLRQDHEGIPGLLVSDACVETIKEVSSYTQDDVGRSGANDHALDSLRYVVMGEEHGTESGDGDDDWAVTKA